MNSTAENGESNSEQSLSRWIRARIESDGPVTFAQFMEWALYHPTLGYYSRGPQIGVRGDFVTSPEASPDFGKVLSKHVTEIDQLLGKPSTFSLVECGPGNGTLARDLLAALRTSNEELFSRLTCWLVEISPGLRDIQKSLLGTELGARVRWVQAVEQLPGPLEGAVIANEFIDAFPVHLLTLEDGRLLEKYVAAAEGTDFKIIASEPSTPALARFVQANNIKLEEADQIEVNLAAEEWLRHISGVLGRGVITIIDYGDTSPARYSDARRKGTLLGYSGGKVSADPLARPGFQDLTALVDFTALARTAEEVGLHEIGATRQANFLIGLGLGTGDTEIGASRDLQSALAARKGLQALVSPEGLGRFHVLILGKGLDPSTTAEALSGLKFASI